MSIAQQIYRVVVKFHLDPAWSSIMPVIDFSTGYDTQQHPITTLLLQVRDQTELVGVVNELHGMGLRLMLVEEVPGKGV